MRQKRRRTPQENELQSGILAALSAYCRDRAIAFAPIEYYPNQQGEGLRRVCADFLATLNNSKLLLAETKVQSAGFLIRFDEEQFEANLFFERCGFPLLYVYNTADYLAVYQKPQPWDYPERTLDSVNCSRPSSLPNERPDQHLHISLLQWLEADSDEDNTSRAARIFAAIRSEGLISNGLMMLIYGTSNMRIVDEPNRQKLEELIVTLQRGVSGKLLSKKQQAQLIRFLDEEANAFASWTEAKKAGSKTRPRLPGDPEGAPPDNDPDPVRPVPRSGRSGPRM